MNVLVTGGAGYVGARLVPMLLADGHKVTVMDTMWFGRGHMPENDNLEIPWMGDIRSIGHEAYGVLKGKDAVIHLASLSNNAMCELNPALEHQVNRQAFKAMVYAAKESGVKRFIYASSVAAYGSSDDPVTENEPLKPTTLYGFGKAFCEGVLFLHNSEKFTTVSVRSASVCGPSANQRFDTTINMMTHDAVGKGVITVNGGEQERSHIHIDDLCDFYRLLLSAQTEYISGQAFNVVDKNISVADTARLVANIVGSRIVTVPRSDNRSYKVDGAKAMKTLGFSPHHTISQAINDIATRFKSGYWRSSLTNPAYQRMAYDIL